MKVKCITDLTRNKREYKLLKDINKSLFLIAKKMARFNIEG